MPQTRGADPRPGTDFAGYRIDGLVARGGLGVVYRARDVRLGRDVALKLLGGDLVEDEAFRRRFERESRVAASLQHPAIVPVYAAGEVDGLFYLAMRYVEDDLKRLLHRSGPLGPERTLALLAPVSDALDAAHERGLVHRDVKPANILVDGHDRAYLADFGLATSGASRTASTAGAFVGTIDYVAPEQIRGQDVDGRSDVYSLGCVLFECLTGSRPFERPTEVAIIYAHLQAEAPRASGRRHELAPQLDAVLARALAKDPAERQATAGELVEAARAALVGAGDVPHRSMKRRRSVLIGGLATTVAVMPLMFGAGATDGPAVASPTVEPPYRATLSLRLDDAEPGAHPLVGLLAIFDDGSKPPGLAGRAPPTGELAFSLQPDRSVPRAPGDDLDTFLSSPSGTIVGYFTSQPGGGTAVQNPIRKEGVTVDGATGQRTVELTAELPPAYHKLVGPTLPMRLRLGAGRMTLSIDLRRVSRALKAIEAPFRYIGVYFLGTRREYDAPVYFATIPQRRARWRATVEARPCLDRQCRQLGTTARDDVWLDVPLAATVTAPKRALYGRRAVFRGTGPPGYLVGLAYRIRPGSAAVCTPATYRVRRCAPQFGDYSAKVSDARARISRDGRWTFAVRLRSALPTNYENVHSATGEYVAAVHRGEPMRETFSGGDGTLFVPAGQKTRVALDRPQLQLRRLGRRVELRLRLAGADNYVHYKVRLRGRLLAEGRFSIIGTAATTFVAPPRPGRIEVRASVWGAEASVAAISFSP